MSTLGVPAGAGAGTGTATGIFSNGNGAVHKMPSSSSMGPDDDDPVAFDSPNEEAVYYREKYRRLVDMLNETRAELDDFQTSSRELEEELERELAATEKQQEELRERIKRLEAEKDEWKTKHINLQKMHSSSVSNMQREMDNLRSERDKTLVALRDLEMGNDELERNERVAVSSLLDLESKYNRAIEEKTLLEQDVVDRQQMEEQVQRLSDELRDANSEISYLKDRLSRTLPTPPSSNGQPMSPLPEVSDASLPEIPSLISESTPRRPTSRPEPASTTTTPSRGLVRSSTSSSIPHLASPVAAKRLPQSPSAMALSRSRLGTHPPSLGVAASSSLSASAAARPGASPAPPASPRRTLPAPQARAPKTKGFQLLHNLQARMRATDDKLGKMPRRNVSAPMPMARRAQTPTTAGASAARPARVAQLAGANTMTPGMADKSMLSPSSWVMLDDDDAGDQPTDDAPHPPSPLERRQGPAQRAVSAASKTSSRTTLPTRPGIPSPLTNLSRSTTAASSAASSRPRSRASLLPEGPMSPSLIPGPSSTSAQLARGLLRSPSPANALNLAASRARPPSRTGTHAALGRGPPPASSTAVRAPALSVSTSSPMVARRSRRSSVGNDLAPSAIPGPKTTPSRPVSVPVFDHNTPPPPVPRIPSLHLRERERAERRRPKTPA